jgi:uncharacterized delta-60 repeat protein
VLTLVLLLLMATIATKTATQIRQSATQQTSNQGNPVREGSPTTGTYWAKTYGGSWHADSSDDSAKSVEQTSDGGYVVAGSIDGGYTISPYAWVLKLESNGSVVWQKSYGSFRAWASSIEQTSDGGYVLAGQWANLAPAYGPEYGYFILKLDSNGSAVWQNGYGVGTVSTVSLVEQTSDGGYIAAGGYGFWVAKLNSTGSMDWQKTYGGNSSGVASSIQQTADGGYIVAGSTNSSGAGSWDIWVLKLNSTGSAEWQKTYGGSGSDGASSVEQTSDGGYIVAGTTSSFGAGGTDFWVLKLDPTGGVAWQKTYGSSGDDNLDSFQQTSDGGYVAAGSTNSFGAGGWDFWVLKLDSTGSVIWQKTYGGSGDEGAHSVQQTSDGGYILAGTTNSFGAGASDAWVVKLGTDGYIVWNASSGASTHTTNVTPSESSAKVSTTSVTPMDVVPTLGDSGVGGGSDTIAIVKTQASVKTQAGAAEQGASTALIVGVEGVAVITVVVAGVLWEWNKSKKRHK